MLVGRTVGIRVQRHLNCIICSGVVCRDVSKALSLFISNSMMSAIPLKSASSTHAGQSFVLKAVLATVYPLRTQK